MNWSFRPILVIKAPLKLNCNFQYLYLSLFSFKYIPCHSINQLIKTTIEPQTHYLFLWRHTFILMACPSAPETTEQEQALVEGASGRAIRSRFFVWPAGQTKRAPLLSLTQDNLCERQSKPQPIYKEGRPKASVVSTVYPRQVRRSNVFQKTELRTNINISLIYLNHSKR